jgi:hypothetical protein
MIYSKYLTQSFNEMKCNEQLPTSVLNFKFYVYYHDSHREVEVMKIILDGLFHSTVPHAFTF